MSPVVVDAQIRASTREKVLAVVSQSTDRRAVTRPAVRPARIFTFRTLSLAATLVVLVAMSFLLSPSAYTYRVPPGQITGTNLTLPDGSRIVLAAGSMISYTGRFGDSERRVSLKGEAFFIVEKSDIPFYVDSYNARTTVVGTQFSVRAWPTDVEPATVVRVLHGQVALQRKHISSERVELLPGQASSIVSNMVEDATGVTTTDVNTAFSWVSGGFAYKNEHVGNVLDDLSRRFNVGIESSAAIRLLRITYIKKTDAPINEILDEVSGTVSVRYRETAGGFELYIL